MRRLVLIASGLIAGGAVWYAVNRSRAAQEQATETPGAETISDYIQAGIEEMTPFRVAIGLDKNAPYVEALRAAEVKHGIPSDLLVRVAYQESRFRTDIITGAKVSSAGAVGLMQIVPRWHPDINPLDWRAAADYAGGYLAKLYRQFGSWALALAAYNWGPGNLSKYGLAAAPQETKNYYSEILADIGGGVYA